MRIRRLKSLIIFGVLMTFVLGAGIALRNIILRQVRKQIETTFHYGKIRLTVLPPAIVLEDVRSASSSPFFAAEKVVLQISTRSLFRRDRPLRVFIDRPVLRLYTRPNPEPRNPPSLELRLPFSVENGVVRDGEIYYWGQGVSVLARDVQAAFRQTANALVLRAECGEYNVLLDALPGPLSGTASLLLEGRGKDLRLRRLTVQGPDYLLKANGVLTNPKDPEFELAVFARGPVERLAAAFDLPFAWDGTADGRLRIVRKGGRTRLTGALTGDDLILSGRPLGRVAAGVTLAEGEDGRVDVQIKNAGAPMEYLDITFGRGLVRGEARGLHLDPIMRDIRIPWPVRSPVWGGFTIENGKLEADGEFRDDIVLEEPGRYPFRGRIKLDWDGGTRLAFASEMMETSFGRLAVDGGLVIGGDIRVEIRGDITDARKSLAFVSRILDEPLNLPDIRGRGAAGVKILGNFEAPEVKIEFDLAPAGFDVFDFSSAGGLVEIARGEASGLIKSRDPDLRGEARLAVREGALDVDISGADGLIERILPRLGIDIPLTGRTAGRFTIRDRGRGLNVTGDIASADIRFAGRSFEQATGRLEYAEAENALTLSKFKAGLDRGQIEGVLSLAFGTRDYVLEAEARGLDLGAMDPKLEGKAAFSVIGRGNLDRDRARGRLTVQGLRYGTFERVDAEGTLEVGFRGDILEAVFKGFLNPGRNDLELLFRYPESGEEWFVSAKGNIFNPDRLLPWPGAKGEIRYLAEVRGGEGPTRLNGVVEVMGTVFPIPDFAHALTDFAGLVSIQNNRAVIRSFQAKMGGGDVYGSGEIVFGGGGIERLDVRADGRDMVLSLFERTRAQADASFHLLKDAAGFSLSGDVDVRKLTWRREIAEKLAFAASPYPGAEREPSVLDDLGLDIRLRAEDGVVLENALGRIEGRFDLTIAGTVASPIILGDIEGLRGSVEFQDRTFRVLRTRLSFYNPAAEPSIDFRGETYLKDYRVTFTLAGVPSKLRPEFSSSPPLPPEDVLALLALGESFKRTYSYDASSGVGTGALISGQLTDEAKKRAEKLFSLDRFRIDPFVLGASTDMTARLTVGKKISRNIILLYSTNLTSQREEIVRLEWEFTESFSLVAMRDDRGRLSIDAKIRRRF